VAASSSHPLLEYLRRLHGGKAADAALDDMQLLGRFLTSRDESAFTTLVQRYGAMVWSLCVRLLGQTPEAEDAFQATFLVLVRKAASLHDPQSLGPWLYGVAYRTALKLRGQRAQRAARLVPLTEQIVEERPEPIWSELRPILDEEINRLPTKYRLPVLLCYLQGLSSEEAAQRLGCAKGTVFSRLSRARDLLRRRLVRRGVEVSAGALAAVLAENAVLRAVPPLALREITIRTNLLLAAGTAGHTLSAPVAALVEGVVRSMFLSKVKFIVTVVLAIGIAGAGTGFLGYRSDAESPAPQEKKIKSPPLTQVSVAVKTKARADETKPASAPAVEEAIQHAPDWREKMMESLNYSGIVNDPRATLSDALDMLAKRYNLTFDINERAFEMDDLKDVARTPIADPYPIPPMRTSLSTILNKILRRVPASSGATYIIRRDHIEITTGAAVRSEIGIPENEDGPVIRPVLPLVWDTFKEVPLAQALPRLAESGDHNVVADPQAREQLQTKITAQLHNVRIETAVQVLANMAGLRVVKLDNLFYVTTPEKAKALREEQAKMNACVNMGGAEIKNPAPAKPAK
jgi:RNA polymerase sigma factor (sigma-70 family)